MLSKFRTKKIDLEPIPTCFPLIDRQLYKKHYPTILKRVHNKLNRENRIAELTSVIFRSFAQIVVYKKNYAKLLLLSQSIDSNIEFINEVKTLLFDINVDQKVINIFCKKMNNNFSLEPFYELFLNKLAKEERFLVFLTKYYFSICQDTENELIEKEFKKSFSNLSALYINYDDDFYDLKATFLEQYLRLLLKKNFLANYFNRDVLFKIKEFTNDVSKNVWLRISSFKLWDIYFPGETLKLFNQNMDNFDASDYIFLRRKWIFFAVENIKVREYLFDNLNKYWNDESPYVRQAFADLLPFVGDCLDSYLEHFIVKESNKSVLCYFFVAIGKYYNEDQGAIYVKKIFKFLDQEEKPGVAQKVSIDVLSMVSQNSKSDKLKKEILDKIIEFRLKTTEASVKNHCAICAERVWISLSAKRSLVRDRLHDTVIKALEHKPTYIYKKEYKNLTEDEFFRVLNTMNVRHWDIDIKILKNKIRLSRGPLIRRKFWRVIYELGISRPDKRQAFCHTVGRFFVGQVKLATAIISETNKTVVPGEPRFKGTEEGWRPYVPLLDYCLPTTKFYKREVRRIYTHEGVTEISFSKNIFKRIKSFFKISKNFEDIAFIRDWEESYSDDPNIYVENIRNTGVDIKFTPHSYGDEHAEMDRSNVTRFFGFVPIPMVEFVERFRDYFYSLEYNSLTDLTIYLVLIVAVFCIRHYVLNRRMTKNRASIPLVVGGWGSRGKSGTERLKAGLFHGLGLEVLSKSTGCEAMVVHSMPRGNLKEVFLFRPFDKATIWEQTHVIEIAAGFGADVFLWECMGLTPSYVRTLQEQWMKDDLSTITNAHPDHEDLQGPAGYNVAQVMCEFIPQKGYVITTEDQMEPILQDGARAKATDFNLVDYIGPHLIPEDVIARFPYDEHPNNMALVSRMGEVLGIDPDYTLKAIADFVVPDLGVLKESTDSVAKRRTASFISGQSANERFAAVGNWVRMGLRASTLKAKPHVWITAVINNRADRIPRSQVFAGILAEELVLDRCVLIGTNLNGFKGYLADAWSKESPKLPIWKAIENNEDLAGAWEKIADRLRFGQTDVPLKYRLIRFFLTAELGTRPDEWDAFEEESAKYLNLLNGESKEDLAFKDLASLSLEDLFKKVKEHFESKKIEIEEITWTSVKEDVDAYVDFSKLKEKSIANNSVSASELKEKIDFWFMRKVHIVPDAGAKPNTINGLIFNLSFCGMRNRIIGMQNIKGTGLAFAYSWEDWGATAVASEKILNGGKEQIADGVNFLVSLATYNLQVKETVAFLADHMEAQPEKYEDFMGQLKIVKSKLLEANSEKDDAKSESAQPEWLLKTVDEIEKWLDPFKAIHRRKTTDKIYKHLIRHFVSHNWAEKRLKELVAEQKGGWLKKKFFG